MTSNALYEVRNANKIEWNTVFLFAITLVPFQNKCIVLSIPNVTKTLYSHRITHVANDGAAKAHNSNEFYQKLHYLFNIRVHRKGTS